MSRKYFLRYIAYLGREAEVCAADTTSAKAGELERRPDSGRLKLLGVLESK